MYIVLALVTMVTAVLLHHLELTTAVATVLSKIADCVKCCTFWSCLAVLLYSGCCLLLAVTLSIVMAYIAMWTGPILDYLNTLYIRLWQKRKKKGRLKG